MDSRPAKRPRTRPRVLLLGPRSSGKSSIRNVVFERMAPSDTLFLERNQKMAFDDFNAFVSLEIYDLSHHPSSFLPTFSFAPFQAVMFVLDAQSEYLDVIPKLAAVMQKMYAENPAGHFEIFMHKMDGMSAEYRLDNLQNLRDRLTEDLFDLDPALENSINVFYHLTSVFDPSIYEALSRVVQKLLPEQAALERLLDVLCQQCQMDKAFLFDISSKLYIAMDSSPLAAATYEICSDYLDLVGDLTQLYEPNALPDPYHSRSSSLSRSGPGPGVLSPLQRSVGGAVAVTADHELAVSPPADSSKRLPSSRVKLGSGATIAAWAVNETLSLVALLRPGTVEKHAGLIDYNVATLREAVWDVFAIGMSPESILQF